MQDDTAALLLHSRSSPNSASSSLQAQVREPSMRELG